MTKLYTRKGDAGATDLLGERVRKDDPRVDLLGDLDEATSGIGLGRAMATSSDLNATLIETQRDLYRIMAEIAFTDALRPDSFHLAADRVDWLESATDSLSESVELAPQFILPGSNVPSATLDLARTIVRRAERSAVALSTAGALHNDAIIRYLNRLSSFLFIAARAEEAAANDQPLRAKSEAN
ncbi:cob(I)yrinic acid a,c-diamide adenosyltransferase [soil metagenome]